MDESVPVWAWGASGARDVDACDVDADAWDVEATVVSTLLGEQYVLLSSDEALGSASAGPFMTAAKARVWKMGEGECRLGAAVGEMRRMNVG